MGITIREWMMKNKYLIIFKVSYKILLKILKSYISTETCHVTLVI